MIAPGDESFAVSARLRLRFVDYRIDVETNSLRLAAKLQTYFKDSLAESGATPPDRRLRAVVGAAEFDASRLSVWSRASSPNRTPKESYYDDGGARYILKNRTGVLITLAEHEATIAGPLEENTNQVVNLIGTMFGLSLLARGYVMVHASAVKSAGSDDALIFLGNSGSGKSSLALQMIERGGYDYVSNDRVLMREEGGTVHIVGLPKKPRVNPGTLLASRSLSQLVSRPRRRAYEQLAPEELWKLEEKTDIDVESTLGARTRLGATLAHAYSLEWRPGGEGLTRRLLSDADAIAAMQTTAKDFGPYDLGAGRDMTPGFARVAACVPFTGVGGKADPKGFAKLLAAERA